MGGIPFPAIDIEALVLACAITLVAGFVKGSVGFAMPMIMISGLASFLPAELAIAALIIPTLFSNLWQALRQGWRAALEGARRFRLYLGLVLIFIAFGAQLVPLLRQEVLFLALGLPVTVLAAVQLAGLRLRLSRHNQWKGEIGVGVFAGTLGGLSGVWGPPTVLFLTALEVPKTEAIRVQGVVYSLGAVALTVAHLNSGLLTRETTALSFAMAVPAGIGMALGILLQDTLNQERFRQITLIVLTLAGLNLVRRGLAG
ncbi:MAG: sulfite exporter TauE/SafE family protein [Pseudomonadota bacterium]